MLKKIELHFFQKTSSSNIQLDALDGLRGIAVLLVLLGHMTHSGLTHSLDFRGAGTLGVYLFFVLSSFLLTLPFVAKEHVGLTDPYLWKNYGMRRFLRIYPLYVTIITFYYILSVMGMTPSTARLYFELSDVVKHLFLLDGKSYLWTIQVETTFYMILPLVVVSVRLLGNNALLVALVALGFVVLLVSMVDANASRESIALQLPVFLVGAVSSVVYSALRKKLPREGGGCFG